MPTIQLAVNSVNWDLTTIIATGLTRRNLPLSSVRSSVTAADLPKAQYNVWAAVRDQLSAIDPGGKVCQFATAEITTIEDSPAVPATPATPEVPAVDGKPAIPAKPEVPAKPAVTHEAVSLHIYWSNTDGTQETQNMVLDTAPVAALAKYILDEKSYK
ncbi:MAG: hypothetical protein RR382_03485 [Tannerellaceae bacterium]